MKDTQLAKEFKWKFKIDRRRAWLLGILVIAIIKFRTVNLTKLVPCLWMKCLETRYKQIQRFFRNFRFDEVLLAKFIAWFLWDWPYILSMDRTNRKYGKVDINILTIGIVYKGVAFPVLRKLLPKRGNSSTEERINLTKKFTKIFWKWSIGLLLADREFIWRERVLWLIKSKIEFILRVRNNTKIEWYGHAKHISSPFKHDKKYQVRTLKRKRKIRWIPLYIAWMKTEDEYLIVISPTSHKNAIEEYGMRWEIESLFWCLKTRWFNFEDTHLQNPERISTMMWVLSICLVWAHTVWEWKSSIVPILIKKHGRKQYSIFRYGLDFLRDIFENVIEFSKDFLIVLRLLSCT